MLTKLLGISKKLIYQEVDATHYPATILVAPQHKPATKKLNPRHAAELTFRIQMCIASGQAYEFQHR